jgi:ABC-type branched-subunit amino acid transport system substrate-binding protein
LRRYGRGEDEILRVGFKRNTLEIDEAVKRIVAERQNLRAVVTVAPYRPAAKFIEEVRKAGLELTVTNVSFVGSTALAEELRQLGPSYCNGIIVTQVVPQTDSASTAVIRYREALAKYFPGEKPDFVSLEGYLASQLLLEGFRRAGDDPTTDSVIGALEQIQNFEMGIGTTLSFGPSEHQASHKVWGTSLNETCAYQGLDLE